MGGEAEVSAISIRLFDLILTRLRLAELFTPKGGLFHFAINEAVSSCTMSCIDYDELDLFLPITVGGDEVLVHRGDDKWLVNMSAAEDTEGLDYCQSKQLTDTLPGRIAAWGSVVKGTDTGDGWLQVTCRWNENYSEEEYKQFFFGFRRRGNQLTNSNLQTNSNTGHCEQDGVRWVHVDAMDGLDRLLLLRLAVKYHLHPLAIDDVIKNEPQTKIDQYADNYFISVEVLSLSDEERDEPARVRIHRSTVSIFVAGPPRLDTVLTIHQETKDSSSFLELWCKYNSDIVFLPIALYGVKVLTPKGNGNWLVDKSNFKSPPDRPGLYHLQSKRLEDVKAWNKYRKWGSIVKGTDTGDGWLQFQEPVAQPTKILWDDLRNEIKATDPRRKVREEKADFLVYRMLSSVVDDLAPIMDAYAKRLRYLRQVPMRLFARYLREVEEVQLELEDVARSTKPMSHVIRHLTEDLGRTTLKMYLGDVQDKLDMINDDVAQLKRMCDTLNELHSRYGDKSMNDTLFALSIVTAIFLPMQFITGLYGMNFVRDDGNPNIPELTWRRGYQFFWGLELTGIFLSCIFLRGLYIALYGDVSCIQACCRRCRSMCERKPRGVRLEDELPRQTSTDSSKKSRSTAYDSVQAAASKQSRSTGSSKKANVVKALSETDPGSSRRDYPDSEVIKVGQMASGDRQQKQRDEAGNLSDQQRRLEKE